VGTWNGWSGMEEMLEMSDGVYVAEVILGETLSEQFHIVLNRDDKLTIHPVTACGDWHTPVEGPDAEGRSKNWLIQGSKDRSTVGTVYKVQFQWGFSWDSGEYKRVTWQATDSILELEDMPSSVRRPRAYFVVGSWTTWKFRKMERSQEEDGLWTTKVKIGISGEEEFQFVVDNDWNQVIHPDCARCTKTHIPVMGPDCASSGKNWLIRGRQNDVMTLQLRILDGDLRVAVVSEVYGKKTWKSSVEDPGKDYHMAATWNDWGFSAMKRDTTTKGRYTYMVTIGEEGFEEFQIVTEKDWNQKLYPHREGALLYEGVLCGPDAGGHGQNWYLEGDVGDVFEIVLDLNQEDKRRVVSWRKATFAE